MPETAFTLPDRAFAAEGIAMAPDSTFLVSSVHLGVVVRVDRAGRVAPFATVPGQWSALGMAVETEGNALWVATAAWPQARDADPADHGRSAIVRFDLDTGEVLARFEHEGALGDVALGPDGAVYATDGLAGTVHVLDGDSLRTLVPPGVLRSPQGLVFGQDPHRMFALDYRHGLVRIDVRTGEVTIVPHVPGAEDRGSDGLAYADGTLYAVMNGIAPHRVLRWRLSPDEGRVIEADVLASSESDDRFSEPTLAATVGPWLYIVAASGWAHFGEDGVLDTASAPLPTILRLRR